MIGSDDDNVSAYYGFWPTLAGFAFGGGLTLFMFLLADGFTH